MGRRRLLVVLARVVPLALGVWLLAQNAPWGPGALAPGVRYPPLVPGVSVTVQAQGVTAKLEPSREPETAPLPTPANGLAAAWQVTLTGQRGLEGVSFRVIAVSGARETVLSKGEALGGYARVFEIRQAERIALPPDLMGTVEVILELEADKVRVRSAQAIQVHVAREQGKLTASGWTVVPAR